VSGRNYFARETLPSDIIAGLVVFLVALPLCLGVALASNAPLFSGILAGIIGGILVGAISKSHTSVSGPAAGLAAVVSAQIGMLGFEAFLAAMVIAGVLQISLGFIKAGFIADFFPSSVIRGLLAAIGLILILKQIPHVAGHDPDPDGDMAFFQPDDHNTFSALAALLYDFNWGATIIGIGSLVLLTTWDNVKRLKTSLVPGPLVVVLFGIAMVEWIRTWGGEWPIEESHLVQVPVIASWTNALDLLTHPNPSAWASAATWRAGVTLAIVASLETLLNLEAVDKLDPKARTSPPNRELLAQGIGNIVAGLIGAIPITSVIVRSSVNIHAGSKTRVSAIVHGLFLLGCVALLPMWLNRIPLSCLAAILIITGFKLAGPEVFRSMWAKGRNQFLPFAITVAAIVLTDLLVGVVIGLGVAVAFILWSNVRRPLHRIVEKHMGGEVMHLQLANQVSFLNRAAIVRVLEEVPPGGHILIDAHETDYIDPDVLDLIHDFEKKAGPSRGVNVSLQGFHERYQMIDRIQFVDYSTRDMQRSLSPAQVLRILKDGHERFRTGQRLRRNFTRQVDATANGQFPLAVILSCIDSRSPAELIFDLGVGDIFSVRIAGNVATEKELGSMEFACAVAGAKLVLVMGHSKCGAVNAAVELAIAGATAADTTGCTNLDSLIREIQKSIGGHPHPTSPEEKKALVEEVCTRNILRTIGTIHQYSPALSALEREGRIAIAGAKYDVTTGRIDFLSELPDMCWEGAACATSAYAFLPSSSNT
jgi:carbonic anhydrase